MAGLATLFRAEEYYAVLLDRRFLAHLRRQLFDAVRPAMLVVVGLALFDTVLFLAIRPSEVALIVGVNALLVILAMAGRIALDSFGPRAAEPVTFAVSMGIVVDSLILGAFGADFAVLATGFVVLTPPVLALLVPWRTWTHGLWLLTYGATTFTFLVFVSQPALTPGERLDVAILVTISIILSFAGHVLGFRATMRSFMNLTDIRMLRHEAETQRRAAVRARHALERVARLDQLTGAGNRLRLHEDLQTARGRIHRTGASCGLLEADIDHFKAVNDALGHLAGDSVLREIADVLKTATRAGDSVYRWGGEEFLIVLPDTGTDEAIIAAERVREAVEAIGRANPGGGPGGVVTVSIGGTVVTRTCLSETDEVWIARADRALYRAKTEGRNRVAFESPAVVDAVSDSDR